MNGISLSAGTVCAGTAVRIPGSIRRMTWVGMGVVIGVRIGRRVVMIRRVGTDVKCRMGLVPMGRSVCICISGGAVTGSVVGSSSGRASAGTSMEAAGLNGPLYLVILRQRTVPPADQD